MAKSIILAAGKGTRMKSEKPKVLHEIFGKALVGYVIDATNNTNLIDENFIIVGHQAEKVEEYINKNYKNTKTVLQSPQLGTGHAVSMVLPYLNDYEGEVIILCGDTPLITEDTLKEFIQKHRDLNVSMEVMMNKPKRKKDGTIEVESFYFTAVTVLGVGVNPAFGEANLVFAKDGNDYQQMMFELNQFENGGSTMPEENQVQVTEEQTSTVIENEGQQEQTQPVVEEPKQEDVKVEETKKDEVDYKLKLEETEAELSRTIVELTKERDDLTAQLQQVQQDMQNQVTTLQQELDALKQYKLQIEKDKLAQEQQSVLDQFSDLQDTDEYKELVENLGDLTPKALEDKLYIIAGRIARQNRKTQKQVKPKLNIATPTEKEETLPNIQYAKFLFK